MLLIQKKIIVAKLINALSNGKKTRTNLKRNNGFPESHIEKAIDFGVEKDILRALLQGYIEVNQNQYSVVEEDYYSCINDLLENYYGARMNDGGNFIVSKTARKNTKVAGRWTRPDFTVVSNRKFPYIRDSEFDIITFEVKRPADCEAIAVFEALAHNTAATRSYVFFPMSENDFRQTDQAERIREECVRHGIGMFLVSDSYKMEKPILIIEAQRKQLNPEKCSNFLSSVLSQDELAKLTTWA
ncbi:hypothetical protein [Novacetimonas hansenii]|uniref:hypothetical protein n=1 Tax=Novacetimonas hansenii TaxID=436 RepID=UPI000789BBF1|nr:hypothetical protein [Novacetimonas hansenii]RFO99735.1 hypothetical protein BGC30_10255 [Novacetimonas hansenii]WEQ58296.1 hypothetical protein LV563_10550 [Novacetimonas hansenii]CUW48563.1 hypothetical protein ATCC53582_02702 [Novacetimonas hansenii]